MSYHVPPVRRVVSRRRTRPAPYPIYPLSVAHPLPPDVPLLPIKPSGDGLSSETPPRAASDTRKIVLGILVVVALMAFLAWLERRERDEGADEEGEPEPLRLNRPRSNIRKQSTAQLAKTLHERLEDRGDADAATMRTLARLAKDA